MLDLRKQEEKQASEKYLKGKRSVRFNSIEIKFQILWLLRIADLDLLK